MALAQRVVVGIVGRRDLDCATAQLGIGVFVGDDGNDSARQRQLDLLANGRTPAVVGWVDSHGRVPEHGLRPRSSDHDLQCSRPLLGRVANVPQVAGDLALFGL